MKKKTLQKATLIMFVSIFLFFVGMFALSAYIIGKNANEEYRIRMAETTMNNSEATIQASLTNYNYLTRLLMINDRIVTYLKADHVDQNMIYEARRGIYEIQNLYNYIDSVFIFRNDEQYVSTERTLYYIDMQGTEHQRILDARGSTVVSINGNGMIRKSTEDQLLTLSRAIYDINSQKQIGMLIMNVSSRYFDETVVQASDDELCIYDIYGNVLCGDPDLIPLYQQKRNPIERDGGIDFFQVNIHGKDKVMAGRKKIGPFYVLCTSGKNTRVLPSNIIWALVITLAAFLCSITLWMIFMSHNVVRPIYRLSEAMEKTKSSGWLEKLDAQMPQNELGVLADSYNTMIEYLNELFVQSIENEKSIQRAEMRVLQEQIKPHFLYNTLETISYMTMQENAPQAHDALEHLGNFYRNFLSKGSREIPLKRELRITQDYLALQKLRYGEVFEAEYDIDDRTLECIIPKLILQPLVENAIYHGVRPKGSEEIIRVSTKLDGEQLVISVYDSGVGMDEEQIRQVLEEQPGQTEDGSFGLAGTIHRIRYFCNDRDVVSIRSEQGEFTEIEIRVKAVWEEKEGDRNYV